MMNMKVNKFGYLCAYDFEADKRAKMSHRYAACYGSLFHVDGITENVKMKFYIPYNDPDSRYCQCLLTNKEIKQWINNIKAIIPFEYRIDWNRHLDVPIDEDEDFWDWEDYADDDEDELYEKYNSDNYNGNDHPSVFIISIKADKLNNLQRRYICTAIRYLYEQPYHVILKDAMMLANIGLVKADNLLNIYQFISIWYSFNSNHAFESCYRLSTPMSHLEIANKLQNHNGLYVNNIFSNMGPDTQSLDQRCGIERYSGLGIKEYSDFEPECVKNRFKNYYSKVCPVYKELNVSEVLISFPQEEKEKKVKVAKPRAKRVVKPKQVNTI